MKLIKVTFFEVDTLPEMVSRAHELNVKDSILDTISELSGHRNRISAAVISQAAQDGKTVTRPTVTGKFKTHIENGWTERRLAFGMVVETTSSSKTKTYQYITGVTDGYGYSANIQDFDQDMQLYFNSIVEVHQQSVVHRGREVISPSIRKIDQVLLRKSIVGDDLDVDPLTTRPRDIFTRRQGGVMADGYMRSGDTNCVNASGKFSRELLLSSRMNNQSNQWLSRSLSALMDATSDRLEGDLGNALDELDILNKACDRTQESLNNTAVLKELSRDSDILHQGYITWGDLTHTLPYGDMDRQVIMIPFRDAKLPDVENSSNWNSDTPECLAATTIANALPYLMIRHGVSVIKGLVIDTYAKYGDPQCTIGVCMPFIEGYDTTTSVGALEDEIETTILADATQGGRYNIDALIDVNVDGFIEITITMDNDEEYFVRPIFADSWASPMLSDDMESVDTMTDDIMKMGNGLSHRRDEARPEILSTVGAPLRRNLGDLF